MGEGRVSGGNEKEGRVFRKERMLEVFGVDEDVDEVEPKVGGSSGMIGRS